MASIRTFVLALTAGLIVSLPTISRAAPVTNDVRRALHVAIYPFIPEAADGYLKIEQAFEALHPDIRLIITQNADYYDPAAPTDPSKTTGVYSETADVYELDSVFLMDFIKAGKIQPLPGDWTEVNNGIVPMARAVMVQGGVQYGLPHWLCSYFLFHRAGDTELASAHTLEELETSLGKSEPRTWLMAEFAGKSTLGELYLDDLVARSASADEALSKITSGTPDPDVVKDLARSVHLIEPGFGRDGGDYHNRIGFYGRVFAHQARAMVSYSEGLHDTLFETMNGCLKGERCLTDRDVDVDAWPNSDAGARQVAWVDLLTVSAAANGQTLKDAEIFIRFMDEPSTYRLLLVPDDGGAPRYLLPALQSLYTDPAVTGQAHLYPKLLSIIGRAAPITAAGLNSNLRKLGGTVDKMLPAN